MLGRRTPIIPFIHSYPRLGIKGRSAINLSLHLAGAGTAGECLENLGPRNRYMRNMSTSLGIRLSLFNHYPTASKAVSSRRRDLVGGKWEGWLASVDLVPTLRTGLLLIQLWRQLQVRGWEISPRGDFRAVRGRLGG